METPSLKEDQISQIPALQMLQKLGYTYLSPAEANRLRGGKTSNVILEDILRSQLKEINAEKKISSTKTTYISDQNIENAIRALKEIPMNEGYIAACETSYNILTLGKTFDQSFDGELKSITVNYIDWVEPKNNVYHVTDEYAVLRSTVKDNYIPDIVLFINGIPLCIIECKRPDLKDPLTQAISQTLRNQQEDGIRHLYMHSQLQLCLADNDAVYGSNDTQPEFYAKWREQFINDEEELKYKDKLDTIKNKPLTAAQKDQLFLERYKYTRPFFDTQEKEHLQFTVQDEYLYNLCRPERLLDLSHNFILFEDAKKKITRYQQFFAIKKAMARIRQIENGKRKGGVVWHTQGSGKSLTMVMLAQAIAMEPTIKNPKIVLVTDRTDLDTQITNTFRKCGKFVDNATTGQRLVDLLSNKGDAVVTTIINKFVAATKKITSPLESNNIFVLVDEGHRTQHGTFNVDMQKTLPNACFIAFTGTPLFKKDKSTAIKFGGIIEPSYTVDQAVKDKAVVPLLYEGRMAIQSVNDKPLDTFFSMVSEPLSEYEKADLKKKFARADHLNSAEQKMRMIAWDISYHFRDTWKGTPFKAQLVCDKKSSAIKYKEFLDEIGIVSSEVLISPIDEREGEETAYGKSSDKVIQFWKKMMDEHGNAKTYEKNIISRFKNQADPEIIIVVDKLLTGFDEPKNTVLYLTRNLQGHKLLQAIARVNRVCPDKEYGYIIDYYGVIENLDVALNLYSSMQDFDLEDLEGTMVNIEEEVKKLPQKHSELWDIFKTITNKLDAEAYQILLKDEALRVLFYDKLAKFAKGLKLALSTLSFHKNTTEAQIERYKNDVSFFVKLRSAVLQRYSDTIDYKQYEGQVQKLIDTHITSEKVEVITELVNIFDKDKFQQEVENTTGLAAKADKIASRTAKHIAENIDEDPAMFKKFSQLLQETIADYEAKRLSEAQYLKRVQEIMNDVLSRKSNDIPTLFEDRNVAKAIFGLSMEAIKEKDLGSLNKVEIATIMANKIDEMVSTAVLDGTKPKVDWINKSNITGRLIIDIGDFLIDEVRDKFDIEMTFNEMDILSNSIIEVASKHYK
jgi:type I restriction enzyme, R subunit